MHGGRPSPRRSGRVRRVARKKIAMASTKPRYEAVLADIVDILDGGVRALPS